MIAHFSVCQRVSLCRLSQEIFDHRDHPLGFRKKDEVAGIRDHGEFSVKDSLRGVGGVLDADTVTLRARLSPRLDGQGLVKSAFPRHSPWRTLIIGRQPGRLVESDLVLNLASPCVLPDTTWVKPGMSSWDWWSQVSHPSTATYRDFIEFSAEMGWPYALLDGGWSVRGNILMPNPSVNIDELLTLAKEKNVKLWVWSHWTSMDKDDTYLQAFPLYEKWGLAGVKIDFMNRDDQEMVNWYEKIAQAAAQHHLMVNFHGAFKPTGMIRTYPNQITREGILGNEYNRWSSRETPSTKQRCPSRGCSRVPATSLRVVS